MTLKPSIAHLAIAAAFLAGVGLVAGVALALDAGGDAPQAIQAPPAPDIQPTRAPEPTRTPRPSPAATATSEPTEQPASPTQPPATATTAPTAITVQAADPLPVSTPLPPEPGGGYEFTGAVWADESIPISYCVNPADPPIDSSGGPLMTDEAFAAVVRNAFQTWENVAGSYIAFSYTGLCSNDPFDTRDRVNTVGWGWLFSTAIGVAAHGATHGQFQRDSSFGQIYEIDLVIDVRFAQSFDDEADYINRALPAILLHEIGHFIGLDHTENGCSIIQAVFTGAPALCEVDANGARALYPQ